MLFLLLFTVILLFLLLFFRKFTAIFKIFNITNSIQLLSFFVEKLKENHLKGWEKLSFSINHKFDSEKRNGD